MTQLAKNTRSTLIPCLRYRDVPAALDWLSRAFGFGVVNVVKDDQVGVLHAQMSFGNGLLMLGPVADSAYGREMRQPSEAGGCTQSTYVVVNSADALYAQAKANGATVVIELRDQDYGGRGFTCKDPEGHLWSFGTFDPWDDDNHPRQEEG